MRTAYLIAGLAYGDEGKGATVDFICRSRHIKLVVRYNGGPQSAHNVVTPEGLHHTFSQFGSGSFLDFVHTHLSRFMLVNPLNMMNEAAHLHELGIKDIWDRTTIDDKCLIVTPFQRAVNRIFHFNQHNTCGQGVGQTRFDHFKYGSKMLFAGDLCDRRTTTEKLQFIQKISAEAISSFGIVARKLLATEFNLLSNPDAVDEITKLYMDFPAKIVPSKIQLPRENILFEGAQGVLLDEIHGDLNYNTWTNTTFENAMLFLQDMGWEDRVSKIGVVRTYLTRHGEGPFRTEDPKLDHLPEPHNCNGCYQGKFRRGKFDEKLIQKAIKILGGVDGIALNHIDVQAPLARHYEIEKQAVIISSGPTANEREWIL